MMKMIVLNISLNVIRLEGHFSNLANRDLDCLPAEGKKEEPPKLPLNM